MPEASRLQYDLFHAGTKYVDVVIAVQIHVTTVRKPALEGAPEKIHNALDAARVIFRVESACPMAISSRPSSTLSA